jgi:hypothetical protein
MVYHLASARVRRVPAPVPLVISDGGAKRARTADPCLQNTLTLPDTVAHLGSRMLGARRTAGQVLHFRNVPRLRRGGYWSGLDAGQRTYGRSPRSEARLV